MRIVSVLVASVLLSCARANVIPDPKVPHRVAEEADIYVWIRQADGSLVKTKVRAMPGWWLAAPLVVEQDQPEDMPKDAR